MRDRIRVPTLWGAAVLLASGLLLAQSSGRVRGKVLDEAGQPIPDVQVTVYSELTNFRETYTTDKKGSFAVAFVDATEQYVFRFEKEGYVTTEAVMKPQVGRNLRQEFLVPSLASQGVDAGGLAEPAVDASTDVFNQGVAAAKAGNLPLAAEKFEEARKKNPRRPEPYAGLASVYKDQGRAEEAAAMAGKALELDPENVSALIVVYDLRREADDEAGAAEALERLRQAGGGTAAAVRAFNAGVEAAREGDPEAALELFREALDLDPGLAPAHGAMASIHLGRGEAGAALEAANAALAADPGFSEVLHVKYDAQRALGDEAGAAQTLETMRGADPGGTAGALFEKAEWLFETGQVAEARELLEQALAVQPDHPRAHYLLGLCHLNQGQSDKAKEHLERFLELAPDDPEAANARSMLEYAG